MATQPQASSSELHGTQPGPTLRTVLTFLILLHLFALFVAVASNFLPVSPLRGQLRFVPGVRQYLQMLAMDLAYNFNLTYGDVTDVDHIIELDTTSDDGAFREVAVQLPEAELAKGIRRRRWHQLAWNVAANVENEEIASMLLKLIGGALLDEQDSSQGHIRCVARLLISQDDALASDLARSDPNHPSRFVQQFMARIWRDPQGQIQLFKLDSAADRTPAPGGGPATAAPPPGKNPREPVSTAPKPSPSGNAPTGLPVTPPFLPR